MRKILTLLALLLTAAAQGQRVAQYNVIPLPRQVELTGTGTFRLDDSNRATAIRTKVDRQTTRWANDPVPNEAYDITIDARGVEICGASDEAVFRGMMTLRKAAQMTDEKGIYYLLPHARIHDCPQFAYRGVHLDCARHFFPIEWVKKYIDIIALHGANVFHWHITDDQGWRFEVKKYPRLTQVGAKREGTMIGRNFQSNDGIEYGGYYTQEECREIVRYAAERHITVMPEIDLPGHMLAALASYPELGCTGGPYKTWSLWGVADEVLCVGNAKTLKFVKDVLRELIDVFPSKMIHLGGDECPKVRWEQCRKCQAKIKKLGIKGTNARTAENQLQSWFMLEAEKFLIENGREMIGWDEILDGGISPETSIMSWRGIEGGIAAARTHHRVVMAPTTNCYLNFYQTKDRENEPFSFDAYLPLSQVYAIQTVPSELNDIEARFILGCQANLWSEYITSTRQAEHTLLPRLAAISEAQWMQQDKRNYDAFLQRLPHLTAYYELLGYDCCEKRE